MRFRQVKLAYNGAHFHAGDLACWTSPEMLALADELGIIFIGYREIHQVQANRWSKAG